MIKIIISKLNILLELGLTARSLIVQQYSKALCLGTLYLLTLLIFLQH